MGKTETSPVNQSTGTSDDAPCDRIEALESKVSNLVETVEEQQETIDDLTEQLNRAEQSRGHIIGDIVDLESDIDDIQSGKIDTVDAGGRGQADTNTMPATDLSPLGSVVNLPEHMVDEQLSSNQERARFIAKDVRQYGDMRKGELVLSTGDIRKVLSAKEEREVHWQTVKRVVRFLDEMGKEDTTVKDRYGTIVCFDPESVARWGQPNSVVTGDKGTV